jgi:hypothetical protein
MKAFLQAAAGAVERITEELRADLKAEQEEGEE